MKLRRRRLGVICSFLPFIAVCLSLIVSMEGDLPRSGKPETGLLFFILPGIASGLVARRRRVVNALLGALLALPFCYVLIHLFLLPSRSVWQELAWLFSAVFWCGIGGLVCLFVSRMFRH
ncbi:inner membrane protein YbjM [Kosakonia oryziphila]|uniref:Putative inner membrane protein n=1 Tax=Kosakonia oryziphila TaxID=1005667 RepID=A0A1C4FPX9_9ENTR|nr:inner membrane protein YbjM [Kosakonia oryziphila]SCC58018.1 Putative inner membrane protein [Kosakonia oryziphila]